MHIDKEGFKRILTKYSKITDPGMLEGTVQYAYDFVEKIPLVKPQAFQVTLDMIAVKRPAAKQAHPEEFLRQQPGAGADKGRIFQITMGKGSPISSVCALAPCRNLTPVS